MKQNLILSILSIFSFTMATSCSAGLSSPSSKGGFETKQYRNVFVEAGYSPAEVDAKLDEVFNDVFYGPNKCYFEVGDSMGYISDIKNNDVRTEGMSYGMMIAVQLDKKDIFDRLWRWSQKYMQHPDGPREGYFAWSCRTDGSRNSWGSASDGELYYITALLFASNRWGNDTGIDYKAGRNTSSTARWKRRARVGPCRSSTPRTSSSPSLPTVAVLVSPTPHIIFLLSTKYGPSGPTTDVPTIGTSVPVCLANICIRPHTLSLV